MGRQMKDRWICGWDMDGHVGGWTDRGEVDGHVGGR